MTCFFCSSILRTIITDSGYLPSWQVLSSLTSYYCDHYYYYYYYYYYYFAFTVLKEVFHCYEQIKIEWLTFNIYFFVCSFSLPPCICIVLTQKYHHSSLQFLFGFVQFFKRISSQKPRAEFRTIWNIVILHIWRDKSRMAKSLNETIQPYLWIVTRSNLKSFIYSENLFKAYLGIDFETWTGYKLIKCVWGVVRQ